MNLQRLFAAEVSDAGKIRMSDAARTEMDRYLSTLKGKLVEISVKESRRTRSNQQLRWYWGCVLALVSEHTGYTAEELHEYFKARFLPKHVALCDGNGVVIDDRVIGGSTGKLTTKEMGEYCEAIREFAASELNINIPDPREVAA